MELIKRVCQSFMYAKNIDTKVIIEYYKNGQDDPGKSDNVIVKAIVKIPTRNGEDCAKGLTPIIEDMQWGERASLCGEKLYRHWGQGVGAYRQKELEALGVTYKEALRSIESSLQAEIDTIQTLFMKRNQAMVNAEDVDRIAVCRHSPKGNEYSFFVVPTGIECQAGDFLIVENLNTYAIVRCIFMSKGKADKRVIGMIDMATKKSIEMLFDSSLPF